MGFFRDRDDTLYIKNRLYEYASGYNSFKDIDKNTMKKVRDKIKILNFDKLKCYKETLKYLTNPCIHMEFPSFDERIFFLIQSVDPDLYMYKEFIATEIVSKAKIANTDNDEEKNFLEAMRKDQINNYITKVRNKIGFFDTKMLTYETDLYRFLHKDKLNSNIKIDCIDKLFRNSKLIDNFNDIDDNRIEKLNTISKVWNEKAKNPKDYNSLAYNILNKSNMLELNSYDEQVLLFMIVADPDFKLLDIYEEESKYDMIKKRSLVELGFYNKDLIRLEKKYKERVVSNNKGLNKK